VWQFTILSLETENQDREISHEHRTGFDDECFRQFEPKIFWLGYVEAYW